MHSDLPDTQRWLLDIRHNIYLATDFVSGQEFEQFRDDFKSFYAVTRCLEIISEASRRLPAEMKERHASIPWAQVAAAGNVYRHDYEDVAQELVWQAVRQRLPELLAVVEQELNVLP